MIRRPPRSTPLSLHDALPILQPAVQVLDGVEAVHPQEVLIQGADEAFGDAVALRLADEGGRALDAEEADLVLDRKSTRLNSSHANISYAVFCLKKKQK